MKILKAKLDFLDDSVIYKYITEEDLMDYCEDIPKMNDKDIVHNYKVKNSKDFIKLSDEFKLKINNRKK